MVSKGTVIFWKGLIIFAIILFALLPAERVMASSGLHAPRYDVTITSPVGTTARPTTDYSGRATANITVRIGETTGEPRIITDVPSDSLGNWSATITLSEGHHTLWFAEYSGGEFISIIYRTYLIDGTPPAAPVITAPVNRAYTNDTTPTISGTAEANATITVTQHPFTLCTTTANGAGNWTCESIVLGVGDHHATAWARDAAGNTGPASVTVNFVVDLTPPGAPSITVPVDGSVINDTTPTISGISEEESTVTVREGTTVLCSSMPALFGGFWFCTPDAALSSGVHTITATATDYAGNTGAQSTAVTFTIDATPPHAPVITAPANGSFTNDSTPTINGTSEANASVTVREGATTRCTATANASGNWTCTPAAALGQGAHTITATAADALGNVSAPSTGVTFTVDTAAPAAPVITTPVNGSLTNDSTPTISGTSEANASVTVSEGATTRCTATANASGNWTCTPAAALGQGAHTITAVAADAASNVSAPSTGVTFTVDTTPPAAPVITAPVNGAYTNDITPTISGTAEANATITVTQDPFTLCTTTANGAGNWTCESIPMGDSGHHATARATDAAGNTGPASVTVNFTVDTIPPAAPVITTPVNGSLTNDSTPTISGTSEANASVTVSEGATTRCTATANASGNWTCTPAAALGEGAHTISATATDLAGNASAPSTGVTFTVDTTPPAAPVITTPANDSLTNDSTPTISGTAEAGSSIAVNQGTISLCTTTANSAGNWSCESIFMGDGAHYPTARATDAVGNISPWSEAAHFTIDTVAPAAPVITTPTNESFTNDTTPAFSGTAEPGVTVTIVENAAVICTVTVEPSGEWSCTPADPLSDGEHSLAAYATDAAGNRSTDATLTIQVDGTAPAVPVIEFPLEGMYSNTASFPIGGTGQFGSTITVMEGDDTICTANTSAFDEWACTPTVPLSNGQHTLIAVARDDLGNTSLPSTPVTFTVDTDTPAAPVITSPVNGARTSGALFVSISGTAEPGVSVTVWENSQQICSVSADTSGNWNCGDVQMTAEIHSIWANAIDGALNASNDSPVTRFDNRFQLYLPNVYYFHTYN